MMEETEDIPDSQKIAIVGIGCRFAGGVDTVEQLWKVLEEGQDCSSHHPDSRYDASYFVVPGEKLPGKMYNVRGHYLARDPYEFDRKFFKMSPDEAQHLSPITRFLLEVTWEALEDAGIPSSAVRGSQTGVYIGGVGTTEYRTLLTNPLHNIGQYTISGNTFCMMSNRLSYEFDFHGPSFSLDTACSSSLYALFLACEALKSKQCTMAISGGVNMLLLPLSSIGFCQAGMVSPDGRSKSFDKSADGFGRGEGFGVVVLKTLETALKDKDRIYAVIRGGALSNDGRTTGITSPSVGAQRKLLEEACLNAKVAPRDVTYAEAHGTGTAVGDKTEAAALGEFLAQSRLPEQPPLLIGSIKSNVGHTDGAAGIAGVIKAALCLKHEVIPRVVHFNSPNPSLNFSKLNLQVPRTTTQWPTGEPLIASCSGFGFGGANACMILEAAPKLTHDNELKTECSTDKRDPTILVLSAASKEALQQRLRDWYAFLQNADVQSSNEAFRAALYTAAQRSHHHQHRIGFVVTTVEEAMELIQLKLTDGDVKARSVEGIARPLDKAIRVAFVFSGMGTQWWGMARQLMETEPVFAEVIKKIAKLLQTCGTSWSLISMLTREDDMEEINKTDVALPSICAVQIGLVELWRSRGIVPDVIVGHSVGEIAAAHCAGLLSLEHTINLIYHRSTQLRKTSGLGAMVAVLHPFSEVLEIMHTKGYDKSLDIAAINSPSQVVASGDCSVVKDLMVELKTVNMRCVQLKVSNAFHSRQQDCFENEFKEKVSPFLRPENTLQTKGNQLIPMLSTVTGRYLTKEEANTADHWWRNIRQQVLFKSAVEKLFNDGFRSFVEIGPHPVLTPAVKDTVSNLSGESVKPVTVGSLVRPRDISKPAEDKINLLLNHAQLFVSGVPTNFDSYFDANCTTVVSIPKYPWQREVCTAVTQETRDVYLFPPTHHPLLGEQQIMHNNMASSTKCWKSKLTKSSVPWLKDHVIGGSVIMPAAVYIEMSLAAARILFSEQLLAIELLNVDLLKFMYAPEGEGQLEIEVEEETPVKVHATIRSHDTEKHTWTRHMEADIMNCAAKAQEKHLMDVAAISRRCGVSVTMDTLEISDGSGLTLGHSFRTTTHAFVNDTCSEILTYSEAPDVIFREFDRYIFHPALFDACFQTYALVLVLKRQVEAQKTGTLVRPLKQVPSKIHKLKLFKEAPRRIIIHALSYEDDEGVPYCDIKIADAQTKGIVGEMQRLEFRKFEADIETGPHVWRTEWVNASAIDQAVKSRRCLIFPDESGISNSVVKLLNTNGVDTVIASDVAHSEHTIRQYFTDDNQHFTDILVLQPLDAINAQNTCCQMTLEEFRNIQKRFPLFCISLILEVMDLKPEVWPRLMFFTAGAHAIIPKEVVNPFMSYIHSIVMTCQYEARNLNAISIDLPLETDEEEKSSIIYRTFLNLPEDENILAYRNIDHNSQATTELSLLAPRVTFEPTSTCRIKACNSSWIIASDKGKAKLSLKPIIDSGTSNLAKEPLSVDIQAICINAVENSSNTSESHSKQFTMYAGIMQNLRGKKYIAQTPRKVLGLTDCKVSPTITLSSEDELVEIPDDIDCYEATQLVKDYLPAQLYYQDCFPLVSSTRILYVTDNDVPIQFQSFRLLACAKGVQTTLVCLDKNIDFSKMWSFQQKGNSSVITFEDIDSIDNSSADLLIVPITENSLQNHIPTVLPKLKKSGTVMYLYDDSIRSKRQVLVPPLNTSAYKFSSCSTSLPTCLCGQTNLTLRGAIEDILQLLKPPRKTPQVFDTQDRNRLSEILLGNGTIPNSTVIAVDEKQPELPFKLHEDLWIADTKASYLVTGGTSGFGLSLVKWLVSRGAIHIFVLSRTSPHEEARKFFSEERVANIQHYKADISNADQVERVLTSIRDSQSPPLAGIFHLAAQYRDGYISNTTTDAWNSVLETKAYGALLLHQLTQKLQIPLKHFVVSSSIVSMIGNAGQVNYCVANSLLNSLCQLRHHMGLPATSMCIGSINTVGYAASHDLVRAGEERGLMSLKPEEVLTALNVALQTETPQLGIAGPLILRRFIQKVSDKTRDKLSLLKEIFAERDSSVTHSIESFRLQLLDKSEDEAEKTIIDKLCNIMSAKLGMSVNMDTDVSLLSLGLDSLMATNVSEAIMDHFEVTINALELINENTSIKKLQVRIYNLMTELGKENIDDKMSKEDEQPTMHPWVVPDGSNPGNSHVIIVCFPPIGAGPSFFKSWSPYITQYGGQMLMIQLPGWEGSQTEIPLHSLQEIVHQITEALVPRLEGHKFVFVGHSLGSLIAFETAHQLRKHDLHPSHMFISSWYAPTLPYPHPEELARVDNTMLRNLQRVIESGAELYKNFIEEMQLKLTFLDDELLSNRTIFSKMLPAIEALLSIIKSYHCENRIPLACGMTVLGGKDDPFVGPHLLHDWKHQIATGHTFKTIQYEGKHMYILRTTGAVIKEVGLVLEKMAESK